MKLLILPDPEGVSRAAAEIVLERLRLEPSLVLGLPTGRTPLGLYRELVAAHRDASASFAGAHVFGLDEYVGVKPDDPASFARYLERHLLDGIELPPAHRHLLPGDLEPGLACARHDEALEGLGGFSLLVLGIGENGHLAFNEPADALEVGTHRVALARATREANAGAFGGDPVQVPMEALTIGMGAILGAREVLLLATGERKLGALERMWNGRVTPECPASFLQLHQNVTVITDITFDSPFPQPASRSSASSEMP